jgi:hypothetical protein
LCSLFHYSVFKTFLCYFLQITRLELCSTRVVDVHSQVEKKYIQIHDVEKSNEQLFSTNRGITLTTHQFALLAFNSKVIDEHIEKLASSSDFDCRIHLGRGVFCTIASGSNHVNIRRYISQNNRLLPTKDGLCLSLNEWIKLKSYYKHIKKLLPCIESAKPCLFVGMKSCSECQF